MSGAPFIETGRRVIGREAEALLELRAALDNAFEQAVEALLSTQGRVIVTGIGKSGHIARKIAATLASTGTPALFVHPAEASHGDLGMITREEVVIAISNSGEAPELANLVAYTRRFGNRLIAITARPGSALGQQADIVVQLPQTPEACGTGVVPTVSTTMTLAVGDALAVALMEHRAFTAEHFRTFHPGGKLGAQLALVEDLMHKGDALPLVAEHTSMSDALIEISQKGFGVVGVIGEDGTLCGVITDGDLRRHMDGLLARRAGEVMTRNPRVIRPNALAQEAARLMNETKITCVFAAAEDGRPLGLLHIHDCLRVGLV